MLELNSFCVTRIYHRGLNQVPLDPRGPRTIIAYLSSSLEAIRLSGLCLLFQITEESTMHTTLGG